MLPVENIVTMKKLEELSNSSVITSLGFWWGFLECFLIWEQTSYSLGYIQMLFIMQLLKIR